MSSPIQPPQESARAALRTWCRIGAALEVGFFWVDWVLVGHFVVSAALIRVLWGAGLLLCGELAVRPAPDRFRAALITAGIGSVIVFCLALWPLGALGAPLYGFLPVLPMAVTLLAQADLVVAIGGTLAALAGALLLGLDEGLGGVVILSALVQTAASGALSVVGAVLRRRRSQVEVLGQEKLADSERLRARAERLATMGALAAGVAHEINNPLGYVKSNLQLLRDELSAARNRTLPDDEIAQIWKETDHGLERIRRIVNDLRTFARDDDELPGERSEVRAVLEEATAVARLRLTGDRKLELEFPAVLPRVKAKQQKLTQVVIDLLLNAADALDARPPAGGGWIRLSASVVAKTVRIVVEDNGPGIPPQLLAQIFDPFSTTQAPGKGSSLGLALSREFLQRAGGTLEAEIRPEGGTRMILLVPVGEA